MRLILPWPPSVNHYKQIGRLKKTKGGKIYQPRINSEATRRFFYEVSMLSRVQQAKSFGDALVSLKILAYPPDKRRRDLDNLLKCTLDALEFAGIIENDYYVCNLSIERKEIFGIGKLEIEILAV